MKRAFAGFEIVPVKKPKLEDLIIPFEKVLRFENEHFKEKEEDVSSATGHQEKTAKQEPEDSGGSPVPSKTTDNTPDKQPPDDDLVYIEKVRGRVSKSSSTIYDWVKKGKFPRGRKDGGSRVWQKSEIDAYVDGEWESRSGYDTDRKFLWEICRFGNSRWKWRAYDEEYRIKKTSDREFDTEEECEADSRGHGINGEYQEEM